MVLRSREGLENFEDFHGPNIEICEEGDDEDEKSVVEGGGGQLIPSEPRNPAIMFKFSEEDLKYGILAPMGPRGLDILKLCSKCCLLTYQVGRMLTSQLILSLVTGIKNIFIQTAHGFPRSAAEKLPQH